MAQLHRMFVIISKCAPWYTLFHRFSRPLELGLKIVQKQLSVTFETLKSVYFSHITDQKILALILQNNRRWLYT